MTLNPDEDRPARAPAETSEAGGAPPADDGPGSPAGHGRRPPDGDGPRPPDGDGPRPPDGHGPRPPDGHAPQPPAGDGPGPPPSPSASLREALAVFALATALCAALYWVGQAVPFVQRNLGGLVALVFLGFGVHMLDRRREPLERYGIAWRPLGRGLAWGLCAAILVLGAFLGVYLLYFDAVCGGGPELLGPLGRQCQRWSGGLSGAALRLPEDFWLQALGQVAVVAIPEEIFYRGYLLGRLEAALPARRTLWGVPVGTALLLHAALFGLGHFLVDGNPLRLGVAVPALAFAFLRHKGGSIVAPVIFHASANVLMLVVDRSFFH